MTILAENTHYFEFYVAVAFLSLITLYVLFLIWGGFKSVSNRKCVDLKDTILLTILIVIASFLIYFIYDGVKTGANITYDVIVDDYNEIYNNGYEVIEIKGEIVTIQKADKGE